jgi:uncharacterized membrane protein (DUF106 family)
MLELLNNICLFITDPLLNWLLGLPADVAIVIVALATAAIITFARKWTTNQDWLRRADGDCLRQKQLAKEAKRRGDKEAVRRHTLNSGLVRMRGLKFEGKPLLLAILPVALLATWCFNRLGYHPPLGNAPVEIKMYFPRTAMDSLAHLVPQDGIEAQNGWVQKIGEDVNPVPVTPWDRGLAALGRWYTAGMEFIIAKVFHAASPAPPPLGGLATWRIVPQARPQPYRLQFVYGGKIYTKDVLVGSRTYTAQADVFALDAPVQALEQVLKPIMFFGFLGSLGPFLPAWLVAYLLIAIPGVSLVKKIFRIY